MVHPLQKFRPTVTDILKSLKVFIEDILIKVRNRRRVVIINNRKRMHLEGNKIIITRSTQNP